MARETRPDALSLLKDEHRRLQTLFEKLQTKGRRARALDERVALLDEVRVLLLAHESVETDLFYPAFRRALETEVGDTLYFEAIEAHHAATAVLHDTLRADPGSPEFSGKAKVLADLVLHHAREEEREIFPKVRKSMPLDMRRSLGERMLEMKRELAAAA